LPWADRYLPVLTVCGLNKTLSAKRGLDKACQEEVIKGMARFWRAQTGLQ